MFQSSQDREWLSSFEEWETWGLENVSDSPKEKQKVTEQGFELRSVSYQSLWLLNAVAYWVGWTEVHIYTQL